MIRWTPQGKGQSSALRRQAIYLGARGTCGWAEKAAESAGPRVFAGQVVILGCCQVAAQVLHGRPAALPAWSEGCFKRPERLPLQTAGPQVHLYSRRLGLGCLLQLTRPNWLCSASVVLWEVLLATWPGSLGRRPSPSSSCHYHGVHP